MRQRNRPTQVLVGFLSFTCIFGVLAPAALAEPVEASQITRDGQLGPPPRITEPIVLPAKSGGQDAKASLTVDTRNRSEVVTFFHSVYKTSMGVPMDWNGSLAGCLPGRTSSAYEEATVLRVNYYRAMAGVPGDVTLDSTWNAKCQAAALMMSAQGQPALRNKGFFAPFEGDLGRRVEEE